MSNPAPRLMIAGSGSGCGKTSVVCAMLGLLLRTGKRPAAFKCGPDYIDPMFHRQVVGVPSRNLDLFLCGERAVCGLLARHAPPDGFAVLEGVMGLYDGVAGTREASSAQLAECTGTPVVLVLNGRGKALTLAAELRGYRDFAPGLIRGVIVNRVSERGYRLAERILREHCPDIEPLGWLPELPEARLASRHLGLVTAAEVADLERRLDRLIDAAAESLDLARLEALARQAPPLQEEAPALEPLPGRPCIGVARDEAFCFHYDDNLELLERLGAELVFFSPLCDGGLPAGLHGLVLSGGYPELYAARLAANRRLLDELGAAVRGGLPTIAECGGFLLLGESLRDAAGTVFRMAGALPVRTEMTDRLGRFGYHHLEARADNLLLRAGERIAAHEFHYSTASDPGDGCAARKPDGTAWQAVHASPTLWAGYPHLHFCGNEGVARRFVGACAVYKAKAY